MPKVKNLKISCFRNLKDAKVHDLRRINIFFGDNGAGKTSVLESLHLLGMGRTFRPGNKSSFINSDASQAVVFAELYDDMLSERRLGISRARNGDVELRLDGDRLQALSSLAALLPLQTINTESFDLLVGGPARRRRFLDWGLFHHETLFLPDWRQYQKLLKQRNNLLRHDRIDELQLAVWDSGFAQLAERIDDYRQSYLTKLKPLFLKVLSELNPDLTVQFAYRRGWDKDTPLSEVLSSHRESEISRGYSLYGPHRADLRIKYDKQLAAEILSRGQQKIVVCALLIAQAKLLAETAGKPCVFLVDDLPSELDSEHRQKVCQILESIGSQVFITGIEKQDLMQGWSCDPAEIKMFHVKHGEITEE